MRSFRSPVKWQHRKGERRTEHHRINVGDTFGLLRVSGPLAAIPGKNSRRYPCECRCGSGRWIFAKGYDLAHGKLTGCGCKPNAASGESHGGFRHGHSPASGRSPEQRSYTNMLGRCLNARNQAYKYYGGRGISVCQRWIGPDGFANFLQDVGRRPSLRHSIDRWPDKNGNYEPGNVRWATAREQQNNRRDNRVLTLGGISMTISQWATVKAIRAGTIWERIAQGWDVFRTLNEPVHTEKRNGRCKKQCSNN
jgi:hypothetical protein